MSRKKRHSKEDQKDAAERPEQTVAPESAVDEVASLQRERDDLLTRLQRVSADYVNYQKRVQRDIAQAHQFANEELIKALLSVLDDMERALAAARENHDTDDPLLEGMQLVHDKALGILSKFGLQRIEAQGQPFDPDLHSAMMQEPSAEVPPQTVVRELQTGYQLKGRTIRPSAVVVSQAPDEQASPERPDEQAQPPAEETGSN